MELHRLLEDPEAGPILTARARALALQEEVVAGALGAATITFRLGGSSYSFPATAVREVQPLGAYTTLPAVPPFICGLVNVRGRLITAIDLRPLLGLPATALPPGAMLLIVCSDDSELGLVADSVIAVHGQTAALAPAPSAASGHSVAWVRGVDADLSLHLDPVALFADPALIVNAEADAQ
jgi:purine-binding chemotaxis protein CheW